MKCLTVCQPWAWAIVAGPKGIENRTWFTPYRGLILIHAGASRGWLNSATPAELPGLPPVDQLVFSAFVGVARVVDCVAKSRLRKDHPYAEGPWCWVLADRRPIKPVPARGALGIWEIPDDVGAGILDGRVTEHNPPVRIDVAATTSKHAETFAQLRRANAAEASLFGPITPAHP